MRFPRLHFQSGLNPQPHLLPLLHHWLCMDLQEEAEGGAGMAGGSHTGEVGSTEGE